MKNQKDKNCVPKFRDFEDDGGFPKLMKTVDKLLETAKKRGYQKSWVWYRIKETYHDLSWGEIDWIRTRLGYKASWTNRQFEELKPFRDASDLEFLSRFRACLT